MASLSLNTALAQVDVGLSKWFGAVAIRSLRQT